MNKKAQVSIEFSFAMIVALLMAFAIMRIFDWTGRDLVDRQNIHESTITDRTQGRQDYDASDLTTSRQLQQINPTSLKATRFNAVWGGN